MRRGESFGGKKKVFRIGTVLLCLFLMWISLKRCSAMASEISEQPKKEYSLHDFVFSQEEKKLFEGFGVVKIGGASFWTPLISKEKDTGKIKGILPDIITEAAFHASIPFEYVDIDYSEEGIRKAFLSHSIDVIGAFIGSEEEAAALGLKLSDPYMKISRMMIIDQSSHRENNKYAVTTISSGRNLPGTEEMTEVRYETPEQCLEALRKGEVSKAFLNAYSANKFLKESKYSDMESTVLQGCEIAICVAFPFDTDETIIAACNRLLESVGTTEKNEIVMRNVASEEKGSIEMLIRKNPIAMVVTTFFVFAFLTIVILYSARVRRGILERAKNRELKAALQLAEKASAAKGEFMSRMSHEIRTPLNAIIGYNTIARGTLSEAKTKEERCQADMNVMDCLTKSELASKHLLTVINDVLDMSAIESGKIKVMHERFDFNKLIGTLTVLFYSNANAKGVDFEVTFHAPAEEWYVGDQMRINQVLTNLLSNAIKFTPENGSVRMTIQCEEQDEGHMAFTFIVSDTGIGMEKSFLTNLWKPFEQADSSIARRFGGTGLGLSITKNLVELMNGSIEVESEPGVGTTFTVKLAVERTDQPTGATALDFSSIKALVVDDNEGTCDYIKLLFQRCKADCHTVTSGEEAVAMFRKAQEEKAPFTLCLIDWHMPKMNGIETVKEIRKISGEKLPIIILTAYDYAEIAEKAKEAGITMFVSKPLFQSSLFDLLANVSGQKTSVKSLKEIREDFTGARVLLAEDNKMNMEVSRHLLETAGITVDSAWNGKEAVAMFETAPVNTYQVILMDVHMPEMNGYEATRMIRNSSRKEAKTIPIIAMTADAFSVNIAEAHEAGMNDHVSKPIDVVVLFDTLKKYLGEAKEIGEKNV